MSSALASILRYRPRRSESEATAWLGMLIFLGSWTMLFAALFAVYGVLRLRAPAWPPPDGPGLPLLLPSANTLAIVASSVAVQSSLRAARQGRAQAVFPSAGAALLLGLLFLAGQVVLWTQLWNVGLRPSGGQFASVFYGLTVFHAIHVLVGLGGLAWVTARAVNGSYGPSRHLTLRLWAGYWHFVGAIWVLLYVTIFVL